MNNKEMIAALEAAGYKIEAPEKQLIPFPIHKITTKYPFASVTISKDYVSEEAFRKGFYNVESSIGHILPSGQHYDRYVEIVQFRAKWLRRAMQLQVEPLPEPVLGGELWPQYVHWDEASSEWKGEDWGFTCDKPIPWPMTEENCNQLCKEMNNANTN